MSRWALVALLCVAMALPAAAQNSRDSKKGDNGESLLQERSLVVPSASSVLTSVPQESVVDPDHYFVGPSDVIAVNIWASPPLSFSLNVTPEGTIIIPTVGEARVADLTLSEAKARILQEVRKKYLLSEVSATLVRPRTVVVQILGNVLNPGLYTMSAVDRANKLIDEANRPSRAQSASEVDVLRKSMSQRHIVLRNRDGREHRVDLPMFFAIHEDSCNPYLREGDIVVVPRIDPMKNVVGVYGRVHSPGRFEFVEGDRLLDVIRMANGPTHDAITDSALYYRQSLDGTSLSSTVVNLRSIMNGSTPDFPLASGDRIVLQGREEFREDYNVDVKGEVRYPATYAITKNQTKVSEVIRRAGGVTSDADLRAATVLRRSVGLQEPEHEALFSQRGTASAQDTIGYGLENALRLAREVVTVDLEALLVRGDSTQDVTLRGEDQIVIPRKQYTVYVYGQVASPGHITFSQGKDADYYVRQAGGFTGHANRGDVKIVKSGTKQWLDPGQSPIEPGDYVWVPAEPDRSFSYYMTVTSQAASILSVLIGVGVLIVQISK